MSIGLNGWFFDFIFAVCSFWQVEHNLRDNGNQLISALNVNPHKQSWMIYFVCVFFFSRKTYSSNSFYFFSSKAFQYFSKYLHWEKYSFHMLTQYIVLHIIPFFIYHLLIINSLLKFVNEYISNSSEVYLHIFISKSVSKRKQINKIISFFTWNGTEREKYEEFITCINT